MIAWLYTSHRSAVHDDRGATAVEYSLLVFFIAAAVIAIVTLLGTQTGELYQSVDWWT